MKTKRISALLLCTAAVLACFGGCSHDTPAEETGTGTAASTTAETVITRSAGEDDLPVNLDFQGAELTVLCRSEKADWEWTGDLNGAGTSLKKAIYEKKEKVENRLHLQIRAVNAAGDWSNRQTFLAAVMADDNPPDLVLQNSAVVGTGAMQGCYADLNQSRYSYINPKKPWWPGSQAETCSVGGHLFCVLGDASVTLWEETHCILENADLAASLGLKKAEEAVTDGTWTAEYLMELIKSAKAPLNPDGTTAFSATLGQDTVCDAMIYGGGYVLADSRDGTLRLSADLTTEGFGQWFSFWSAFVQRNDIQTTPPSGTDGFASGTVLFHFGTLSDVRRYVLNTKTELSVLPYPKQNAEQKDYYSLCTTDVTAYSIPANAKNPSLSAAALEALGAYGYQVLSPAYLANMTENPRLDSKSNTDTFALLHRTLVFDPARLFAEDGNCYTAFRQLAVTSEGWDFVYRNNRTLWENGIRKIAEKFS